MNSISCGKYNYSIDSKPKINKLRFFFCFEGSEQLIICVPPVFTPTLSLGSELSTESEEFTPYPSGPLGTQLMTVELGLEERYLTV